MTLGRSTRNEFCFPEDVGLSRQHLMLESDGDRWFIQDLGSKNGTQVNDIPLRGKLQLKEGDRITAGHLTIVYHESTTPVSDPSVEFLEEKEAESPLHATVVTNLEGVLSGQKMAFEGSPQRGSQMQALIRAGQELAGATNLPLPELFPLILDLAIDAVGAYRGVLMTLEEGELVVKAKKGEGFRISSAVRDRVLNEKTSILVSDARLDDLLRARVSIVEQMVRTLMAVPLQTRERIIGLIYVDAPSFARAFSEDDLSLLTVMANTAAIRIEHARLAEVEEAERRMAHELAQAAEIQRSYLPERAPCVPGLDLAGYNAPSRTVGGDYYGFFPYPDGRVALALGDVSGKGMPASLMMMGLQARVEVLAEQAGDLGAIMTRLNKITCARCPTDRFITFIFCVLDPSTGELAYANAGHSPPIVVHADGELTLLEGGGPVLGVLPDVFYQQNEAQLQRGDLLVLYSDGVTDATDPDEEQFGDERFQQILCENRHRSAGEIVDAVTEAIRCWSRGSQPADDITLVIARLLPVN